MKFKIDGREYADYQLSDTQLMRLLDGDNLNEEEREHLTKKALERFKHELCHGYGENENNVFARFFSSFVNGKWVRYYEEDEQNGIGKLLCREHRYLQNEMFKVCLEYIKELAKNCEDGRFDGRNEYACKTSKKIIDYFKEIDYPY